MRDDRGDFRGNGGGNGASHGNAGGQSASAERTTGKGATASALGALNAAHASAQAFAHASPNSRLGKIKAYYLANQEAAASSAAFDQALTDASLTQEQFDAIKAAYDAHIAAPENAELQAAYDAALGAANTSATVFEGLLPAYETAQQDSLDAEAKLSLAANKTPVSDETKLALDALLEGKITTP